MIEDEEVAMPNLYIGLTTVPLEDKHVDLGGRIFLRGADATFVSSLLLVNTDEESMRLKPGPAQPDGLPPLPRPAFWQLGGERTRITAELSIPGDIHPTFTQQFALARFIGSLLRLWTNPAIRLHAMSDHPFTELIRVDEPGPRVFALESFERHVRLGLIQTDSMIESLSCVQANWRTAHRLYASSSEFRLAADALDSAQFVHNDALALISCWAAMEALFSPSTTELKFRVSALIASFLEPPGEGRRAMQKAVGTLYDKRSAAARGKPKHDSADLIATFELLRKILMGMIHQKAVPSKDDLNALLFGG